MRIIQLLSSWAGWCPMKAAASGRMQEGIMSPDGTSSGQAGPTEARANLFSSLKWLVAELSYIVAFLFLPFLPEQIPVHWNLLGEPDGFAGRSIGAFGLPIIITLTTLFFTLLPRVGKMQSAIRRSWDIYQIVTFSVVTLIFVMEVTTLLISEGMDIPVSIIFPMFLGLLLIVIGSFMPYTGRNPILGIRLPWTLRDDEIWRRTHEMGGPAFVGAGAVIVLVSPMAGDLALIMMLLILAIVTLYTTIYSYRISQEKMSELGNYD
ncbi:SdpI family protein [uncultured Methanospirillum sp.]|uniref:SdpI family protein n=1 Tax=uncultured Methanospirillum sp. TaxID=262503 RepID=UPI0029C9A259|nr:SdpI family protein [uncultured Methanospirillum sp.]